VRVRRDSWPALLICLALLAAAALLRPDARGYGTHEQLLLLPCFFRLVTRQPCPFCGMTTGFAQMARGDVAAAARANLMAPPAFLVAVMGLLGGLYGVVTGRRWVPGWLRHAHFARALFVVIMAFWAANLVLHNWPHDVQ
jgi:hypothetical protein